MDTKYIFVTGGVVSGLGKGITAASLGRLLKARGYKVTMQKFDPYINMDPGTMSPYQHGEVFVTDDGAETDLDLGHYERFIDENPITVTQAVCSRSAMRQSRRSACVKQPLNACGWASPKSALVRILAILVRRSSNTRKKQAIRWCANFAATALAPVSMKTRRYCITEAREPASN